MGEIADAMLNGDMCAMCGVMLENEEDMGIPMYCSDECMKDGNEKPDKSRIGKEV